MPTAEGELAFAGPARLAALVRAGEVHPRELVELSLRRIEALDPQLNAFRTVLTEEARPEAAQTLYALAAQIEAARPWAGERPSLAAAAR